MAAAAALLQATRPQQVAPAAGQPTAFFRRDYVSGFNRVCVYDRLGSEYVITIPAMNICPLQAP